MATQSRPTLILTRPLPAAERFATEVRARFGERLAILTAPLMAPRYLTPALPEGAGRQVLFTSETGVEALRRLCDARGRAICVGPRTAEAARTAGWRAEVLGGDAEGLVAALAGHPPEGRWLHARGREAAGNLAARLVAGGMRVEEAVVYAQDPLPLSDAARAAMRRGDPVVIAVFSPRSARLFMAQAPEVAAPLWLAAISPAAVEPVQPLAPTRLEIAQTPDGPGMLDAIARLLDPPEALDTTGGRIRLDQGRTPASDRRPI